MPSPTPTLREEFSQMLRDRILAVAQDLFTRQGYHAIHWTEGGFAYWAISDLNEQELQEFARLIQQK